MNTMDAADATYAGTQAVTRAITLLKSFTDNKPEWRLNDLADTTGLNRSTTYRLLAALENERLIVRNPESKLYSLGPELIALGGCAMRSHDLRTIARPYVQTLAEATGEAATLEILAGSSVIVVDETSGQHLVGMSQDIGTRLPAHATSTGKVMLAYAEPEALESVLAVPLSQLTEFTVQAADELRQQLAAVREQGYAIASNELEVGFVAVAAPIFNHERAAIAAISIGGPSARLTPEQIQCDVAKVIDAANQVSSRLGYRPQ